MDVVKGRVSVIIPYYNQQEYLLDAVNSAIASTHEDIEIIVVDDCSLQPLPYLPDWVEVVRHEVNRGLAAARNTGIRAASGEYILPLDSDDKIHPTYIEKALKVNADIVSCYCQHFGKSTHMVKVVEFPDPEVFLRRNQINCCSLFKKEMWEKIGGYDESMRDGFEDWEYWIRATKAGYRIQCLLEPLFYYRRHGPSLVNHALLNKAKIMNYMRSKHPMKSTW